MLGVRGELKDALMYGREDRVMEREKMGIEMGCWRGGRQWMRRGRDCVYVLSSPST